MPRIRSLHPNLTREEAIERFSRGAAVAARNAIFGELQSVSEFYIPYRFFQVSAGSGEPPEQRIFGVDAVTGRLNPYEFTDLPGPEDIVYIETRHCPPVLIDEPRARELLLKKAPRPGGWFGGREAKLSAE